MFCWNCGARNSEDNSFCGRCGKRIAKATAEDTASPSVVSPEAAQVPPMIANDPAPLPSNPIIEEPRVVHDSPRTLAQMEIAPPANVAVEEKVIPEKEETKREEPLVFSRTPLPANRITGPSFLGLSDEPTLGNNGSSYLLDDEEPKRSSWRAWVAIAVLAIFGFLIYKQWNAIRAGAEEVAQKANGEQSEKQKPSPNPPAAAVSSAQEQSPAPSTSPDTQQSAQANPPSPANPSSTPDNSLDKPENDHTPAHTTTDAAKSEASSSDISSDTEESDSTSTDDAKAKNDKPASPAGKRAPAAPPAEANSNDAQVTEAERYITGQGVTQDCGRGISLLRSSAREGNPRAQVKLGALYATGQCVTQDRAAAYQWLLRAQETQPHNSYLQRTMNTLWANMTADERDRITR